MDKTERNIEHFKRFQYEVAVKGDFTDLDKLNNWWLLVNGRDVDVCLEDPGQNVDVYLTTDLRTMVQCWMGDRTYKSAIAEKQMKVVGPSALTRNIRSWIADSAFSDLPPAHEI